MTAEPHTLTGFVLAVAVMVAVALAVFLPLFWWLPATSAWRYLTWVAAFLARSPAANSERDWPIGSGTRHASGHFDRPGSL